MYKLKTVVVGAGIVGTSIAWRLNQEGAEVTLIDGNGLGGIAGPCSFGWINATYGNPRSYYELRVASMKEWETLSKIHKDLPYQKTGTLYVEFNRIDLSTFLQAHSKWGYNIDWVNFEQIGKLEPNLISVPEKCLFAPNEGAVRVEAAALYFANRLQEDGGKFIAQSLDEIITVNGRVTGVAIEGKIVEADHVIVAAGSETQTIASNLGINIPMKKPPGLLVRTKPCSPVINGIVLTTGLHVQQEPDGTLLAGADFGGGELVENPGAGAMELMNRIRRAFQGAEKVEFDRYTLGYRPTPDDGMPVIGPASHIAGLYFATMHSGATLAAIVSKFVTEEILSEVEVDMLAEYRPARFLEP